jgi:hypothetical protein
MPHGCRVDCGTKLPEKQKFGKQKAEIEGYQAVSLRASAAAEAMADKEAEWFPGGLTGWLTGEGEWLPAKAAEGPAPYRRLARAYRRFPNLLSRRFPNQRTVRVPHRLRVGKPARQQAWKPALRKMPPGACRCI